MADRAYYTSEDERSSANVSRKRVRETARRLGLRIDTRFGGSWHEIVVTAPDGKIFSGTDVHELVTANAGPTTDGLWQRVEREDLRVETCAIDGCEWCHDV